MIDLRQLSYFVAVAETQNVGHAAARLRISQSPLSRQIKQLEASLNVRLFERSRQRLHLTPEGLLLLSEARALLTQAGRLEIEARTLGRGEGSFATVGYTEGAVHAGVLAQAVRRMRERHSGVELSLNAMRSNRQIEAIRRREIDVGFVYSPPDNRDPDLVQALAFEDPLVLAVPASDSLAEKKAAAPTDLDGRTWISSSRFSDELRDRFLGICRAAGFNPSICFEADEPLTMLGLVGAGLGTALCQSSLRSLSVPGVAFLDVPWFPWSVKIYTVRRRAEQRRHILTLSTVPQPSRSRSRTLEPPPMGRPKTR